VLVNLSVSQVSRRPDLGHALGRFVAFADTLEAEGVTPLEYQAMLLMKTRPGESMTLRELGQKLTLARSFMCRLADRLVENDLAVRRPSHRPADTVVQLSAHGGEILADLAARHIKELRCLERILAEASPPLRKS
jgi:DNA-binding MarR family transcriptional regulator